MSLKGKNKGAGYAKYCVLCAFFLKREILRIINHELLVRKFIGVRVDTLGIMFV